MQTHNIPRPSASERVLAEAAPTRNILSILAAWGPMKALREECLIATVARYARRLMGGDGQAYDVADIHPQPGTPTLAAYATGVLTGTEIVADDTVTIGDETYTFVATLTTVPEAIPYEVLVGVSDSASLDNLIAAVNGAAGAGTTYATGTVANPLASAAAGAGDTMDVTARALGPDGNAITTTASLTSGDFAAATLEGGSLATPARAGARLYDSSYLYLATSTVMPTSTTGWRKISHAAL